MYRIARRSVRGIAKGDDVRDLIKIVLLDVWRQPAEHGVRPKFCVPCNRKTPLHNFIRTTGNMIDEITYHKLILIDNTIVKSNIQFGFGKAPMTMKIAVQHGDDVFAFVAPTKASYK